MTLPANPTMAQELAHAQAQLAKAQKNKDQRRIQDWSNRVSQVKAGTFTRNNTKPQAVSDKQIDANINSGLASGLGNVTFADPNSTDPALKQSYIDSAYASLTKNFESDYGKKRDDLHKQLIMSGNAVGSPLYNQQMQLLLRDESDAKAAAGNQATMTGADYYNQDYNNKLNAIGTNTSTLGTLGGLYGQKVNKDLEKQRIALEKFKATPRGGPATTTTPVFNNTLPTGL